MKKPNHLILVTAVTLLASMVFVVPAARAQKAIIKLAPGSSPVTVKGHANPLSGAEYKLTVSANQRVAMHLTSTSRQKLVRFNIRRDRFVGEPLPGANNLTDWEGVFKEGGDYWIPVYALRDAGEEDFTLIVSTPAGAQANQSGEPEERRLDPALVRDEAARPEEFAPRGWRIYSRAAGDLDGDGRSDLALILLDQSVEKNPRSIENPRPALLILLSTPEGRWRRAGLNTRLIVADGSSFSPLRLEIVRGVVVVRDELQSDISANTNDYATTYRFRYDATSSRFLLIGEENTNTHRDAAENGIRISDNYLTGERLITVMHAAHGKYVSETNTRRRINQRSVFLEDAEGREIDFEKLMDEVGRRK